MRLTLESTSEVGTFYVNGATVPSRIWLGTTERGNKVLLFVARIAAGAEAAEELGKELDDVTSQANAIISCERRGA